MRIGFLSGDVVEMDNTRKGVSVPDYPVQGFLMKKLVERGHEVVLLTRPPHGTHIDTLNGIDCAWNGEEDVRGLGLDILFGDRLGNTGSEWEPKKDETDASRATLATLERYQGPVVFHQYIAHSGWAPPFAEMPHLLGVERDWLILNRAKDPMGAYHAMVGVKERVVKNGTVRFEQWEPFLMREYPWMGEDVPPELVGRRPYAQGYYGRLPKSERRAQKTAAYLNHRLWSRVVYGPETSTGWASKSTGAHNGGRVLHKDLPLALTTFSTTVQVAIDRLRNKGRYGYWPHRIVECALAGVYQLFDVELGLPEFKRWEVRSKADAVLRIAAVLRDDGFLRDELTRQREVVLPHAEPVKVMDRLEELLKEHAS